MGDWEEEDWESAEVKLPAVAAPASASKGGANKPAVEHETKGQAVLAAAIGDPDMSKFADEDQEEEPEKDYGVAKTQPKKKEEKKWQDKEGAGDADGVDDVPLDDPLAEKARRQRLVEESDLAAAKDLFSGVAISGGGEGTSAKGIDGLDAPKSEGLKDFEDYAAAIADRFFSGLKDSKHYKALVKALVKKVCEPLSAADSKDVEASVTLIRVEKTKLELAAAAKAKTAPRKSLKHQGKAGLSAGLDDYKYNDAGDADDDFM